MFVTTPLAGCGGDAATESAAQGRAALPDCATPRVRVARPPTLPRDFPLPPGHVLTAVRMPFERETIVIGVMPSDFRGGVQFFERELPARGYALGRGDAERGEAEAPFTGNGYRGRWRINTIPDCDAAMRFVIILISQS